MFEGSVFSSKNSIISLPRSAERFKELMSLVSNEIVTRPAESPNKTRRRNALIQRSFKTFVLRVKRLVTPSMAIGSLTLKELDHFIVHMIDLLETELYRMYHLNSRKTLSIRDMEIAVKLCFPTHLADSSAKFGQLAVCSYFERVSMPERSVF
ncbi:putative histone H2B 3 like protein [Argiope bruennichi]|uniref:Putative histone H2B 3 like protein n=1 Tax=Argiope bruennichi TaxID=94029 RepID=A0A8T0FYK2_ARGBR|nr:putative histone H2B 3 like protein [Argiope bruennichi]